MFFKMVKTTNQLRSLGSHNKIRRVFPSQASVEDLLAGRKRFASLKLSAGWVKISILSPDFFAWEHGDFIIKQVELR